jgi:hypothetical protein
VNRFAQSIGFSESAAARYLMVRGLEQTLSLAASQQSSEALAGMFARLEQEIDDDDEMSFSDPADSNRAPVTPGWADKNVRGGEDSPSVVDIGDRL